MRKEKEEKPSYFLLHFLIILFQNNHPLSSFHALYFMRRGVILSIIALEP